MLARNRRKNHKSYYIFTTSLYLLSGVLFVANKSMPEQVFFTPIVKAEVVQEKPIIHDEYSPENHIRRLWGNEANIMIAIAYAESGFNCSAVNETLNYDGSGDYGLLQINSIHGYSKADMLDCSKNIEAGYKIYLSQGFRAWSAYNNGTYRKFL